MSQEEAVRLSPCEQEVWDKIIRKLVVAGKDSFNADDLRNWNLDEALYGEDLQKAGIFFLKLLRLGLVKKTFEQASTIKENHFRRIWNYQIVKAPRR